MIISNVPFRYGEKIILDDFSLDFSKGIYCLMGPSASGKTTLLKLLAGLLKPEKGTVDLEKQRPVMMFQEDRLLPWYDAEKNVELIIGKNRHTEIEQMFKRLEVPLDGDIRKMSGGQKRRVALIRALLAEGEILLLDEPFTGMDEELMKKAAQLVREQNKLTVVATHSLKEAELLEGEIIRI
ncbi:MAG: ATP-binding cassette domain-containing protein [Erysipelotrichaceae bacterium]|nr:ATP-binding cassette domain-containing protein [Erysipelotrichaceae bacterium]